jgi:hypothetical protein
MHFLRRIAAEIRRGENIDLYVTIVATPLLVILTIAGVTEQFWIAPLTIAVLALLATNMLVSRHRMEDIQQRMNLLFGSHFLREKFPAEYETDIKECKDLWIVGINTHRFLADHYTLLKDKLASGHLIRVLVMNPYGKSMAISVGRSGRIVDVRFAKDDILNRLSAWCELQVTAPHPENLQIRTIDYPIAFGGYVVNHDPNNGVVYLKHYGFKMVEFDTPKMVIRSGEGRWFQFFKSEIQNMWDMGQSWDCNVSKK